MMSIGDIVKYTSIAGDYCLENRYGDFDIFLRNRIDIERELGSVGTAFNSVLFEVLNIDLSDISQIQIFLNRFGLLSCSPTLLGEGLLPAFRARAVSYSCLLELYQAHQKNDLLTCVERLSTLLYLDVYRPFIIKGRLHKLWELLTTSLASKPHCKGSYPSFHFRPGRPEPPFPFSYDFRSRKLAANFSFESLVDSLTEDQIDALYETAAETVATHINCGLRGINTIVFFRGKELINCRIAKSLDSLIIYELNERFTAGNEVRRCANNTCGNYFQIYGNDKRKIYCSPNCAHLEAKRKQRQREKEKKVL